MPTVMSRMTDVRSRTLVAGLAFSLALASAPVLAGPAAPSVTAVEPGAGEPTPPPSPPSTPAPPASPPPANPPPPYPPPGYGYPPPPYPPPGYGYPPPGYGYPPPGYGHPPPGYPGRDPRQAAPRSGAKTHDGFFIRMALGLCLLRTNGNGAGTSVELDGVGAALSVAIGGALNRHLILFGEVLSASTDNRKVIVDGVGMGAASGQSKVGALGAGVASYLSSNLYFSGTFLFPQITASGTDTAIGSGDTKFGLGLEAMIGKEWWVSANWGLGVGGQILYARADGGSVASVAWRAWGATLVGSATFN